MRFHSALATLEPQGYVVARTVRRKISCWSADVLFFFHFPLHSQTSSDDFVSKFKNVTYEDKIEPQERNHY